MDSEEERGPFFKQGIVIRKDLDLNVRELISQGARASHLAARGRRKSEEMDSIDGGEFPILLTWILAGRRTVVKEIEGEEKLLSFYRKVNAAGLPVHLVKFDGYDYPEDNRDIHRGTLTAVGVGPADVNDIDEYTNHLDLFE